MEIKTAAAEIHKTAASHGWWDEDKRRSFGDLMALLHSEVSEAFEAYREGKDDHIGEELADVAIRLFDTSEGLGYDIEAEIIRKMAYNKKRPYRHGGKRV